ncbi:hypothetical protein [Streptomyces sp. NPDC052036]|uniref:hypothetical protein n=1 Tax=Streptomyces sp. NPDC052036 TaxID=3155171 RepID=UPI0034231224
MLVYYLGGNDVGGGVIIKGNGDGSPLNPVSGNTANIPTVAFQDINGNNPTPDGTTDWSNWTIATMQLPTRGGGSGTAMYLWKKSTGELDLWENLAADPDAGNLTYTSYLVATGWNTGAALTLQAADANGDGIPDLWAVSTGGTVTANLFTNLSTTAPVTQTQVTETLTTD